MEWVRRMVEAGFVLVSASKMVAMAQAGGLFGGGFTGLGLMIVLFIGLYALMIVPGQRKQKAWQLMLSNIKTGDRVTTSGGIRGTVIQVKDEAIVLRVQPDGVKLEFAKAAISAVTTEDEKA
jgi:preprotein translocase subunit YajC